MYKLNALEENETQNTNSYNWSLYLELEYM